jgi:hypothetical protein
VADAPNPLLEPIARVTKAWAEATDAERVTMLRRASIRNRDRMARDLAQQIAKLLRLWEEKPTDGHIPVLLREMDKYVARGVAPSQVERDLLEREGSEGA